MKAVPFPFTVLPMNEAKHKCRRNSSQKWQTGFFFFFSIFYFLFHFISIECYSRFRNELTSHSKYYGKFSPLSSFKSADTSIVFPLPAAKFFRGPDVARLFPRDTLSGEVFPGSGLELNLLTKISGWNLEIFLRNWLERWEMGGRGQSLFSKT